MDTFQKSLNQLMSKLPRMIFESVIDQKLKVAGVRLTKKRLSKLADHLLSGETKPFPYKGKRTEDVNLVFDEADMEGIERKVKFFCEHQLSGLVESVSDKVSIDILNELTAKWGEEGAQQRDDCSDFRARLEERWGKPLDQLRMLLTISREWLQTVNERHTRSKKSKKHDLKDILIRLHVRASQVVDEIICLLENGFADGAMARWRTLHEIAVVAVVLSHHGEDILERYIAHQAVESKRAMDKYMTCYKDLGYQPLSTHQTEKITKAFEDVIAKYGKGFKSDYGWAAKHLKRERPTFSDLEAEAGRAEMRSYNQMANDNIHVGIKSLFVRLGMLEDYTGLLAGRSNAGLMEPGQNAAHTLTQLSVLVGMSEGAIDDILAAKVMQRLRDEIPKSFGRAHQQLKRDDRHYRKKIRVIQ